MGTIADLEIRIEKLKHEIELKDARILDLETQLKAKSSNEELRVSGWLVTCPNASYTGMGPGGVRFQGGRAFVIYSEENEALISIMKNDFHYEVKFITDWKDAVKEIPNVEKSMIDILGMAQVL